MEQKHFMDIVHIREESDELKQANTGCFESGDIIQISEKWDGSNACAAYDIEADSMVAFQGNVVFLMIIHLMAFGIMCRH